MIKKIKERYIKFQQEYELFIRIEFLLKFFGKLKINHYN